MKAVTFSTRRSRLGANLEEVAQSFRKAVPDSAELAHKPRPMRYLDSMVDDRHIVRTDPSIRFGKPCIRGMRIAVSDILGWLAAGMSYAEILADYPDLNQEDIYAALAFAADRENHKQQSSKHADPMNRRA